MGIQHIKTLSQLLLKVVFEMADEKIKGEDEEVD